MNTQSPDDRLEIDAAIDRAWRAASTEEPPPGLDTALIAAARTEVADAPRSAGAAPGQRAKRNVDRWPRWRPLAAAAVVAGLAFALVQTIPRDRALAPPVSLERVEPPGTDNPVAGAAAPPAAARAAEAGRTGDAATVAGSVEQRTTGAAGLDDRPPMPAGAAPATAEARETQAMPSPGDWTARIEALYASGAHDEAARALRAFRAAHGRETADRYLPETLQAWAATVE